MGNLGLSELLLIGLIALIVLGPQRLPELARSLGQGMKAFQDTLNGEQAAAQRGGRMAMKGGGTRGNGEGGGES